MVKSSKSRLDQKSDGSKQVEWRSLALISKQQKVIIYDMQMLAGFMIPLWILTVFFVHTGVTTVTRSCSDDDDDVPNPTVTPTNQRRLQCSDFTVYPARTWLKAWQTEWLQICSLVSNVLCLSHLNYSRSSQKSWTVTHWGFLFFVSFCFQSVSHPCRCFYMTAVYLLYIAFFVDCNVSFLPSFVWNNASKYSSCGTTTIWVACV